MTDGYIIFRVRLYVLSNMFPFSKRNSPMLQGRLCLHAHTGGERNGYACLHKGLPIETHYTRKSTHVN